MCRYRKLKGSKYRRVSHLDVHIHQHLYFSDGSGWLKNTVLCFPVFAVQKQNRSAPAGDLRGWQLQRGSHSSVLSLQGTIESEQRIFSPLYACCDSLFKDFHLLFVFWHFVFCFGLGINHMHAACPKPYKYLFPLIKI